MSTVNLPINVPEKKKAEMIDSVVRQHGYTDTVDDGNGNMISNPVTKNQWFKRTVINFLRESWRGHRVKETQANRQAIIDEINDIDIR